MQTSPKTDTTTHHIDILLFEQFSNHCLANTVEPLRAANTASRNPLYAWQFCTLDGQPVHSSSGLHVAPHVSLDQSSGRTLVVMPSYGVRQLDRPEVARALRHVAGRYDQLFGMDTGSWLLARAGLLDGCRATIHWDELQAFEEAFPQVDAVRERFVIDRNRVTCSGAMAAFDLVVHLISVAHGPFLALQVAQLFMSPDAGATTQHTPMPRTRTVSRAIALMQETLDQPLPIPVIAQRAGCTQKTLELRVRKAMQITPQALYHRLRLNLAFRLVRETDQNVSEIATRCGYENASAMTRAFRKVFGQSPSGVRKQ